MFSDVLNYVLRISCSKHDTFKVTRADSGEEDVKSKQGSAIVQQRIVESVCVECFKFLKALAKDHFEIQTR